MSSNFVINAEFFEKAIPILESRAFIEQKDARKILLAGLSQLDYFKTLMRDPLLEHRLYPYLDDFAQQVSYKHIPKGRIIYHDGENVGTLFFVLRGNFAEFRPKSEDLIKKELYWDSQAEIFKDGLAQITQSQLNHQNKRTEELLQLENELSQLKDIDATHVQMGSRMSLQSQQLEFLRRKRQEQEMEEKRVGRKNTSLTPFKKMVTLEEVFFTEEFKNKQNKLKQANEMASENVKFYSCSQEDQLLQMENKHKERYFRDHKCIYKKSKTIISGMCFGELYGEEGKVDSTIVCSEQAFILSIPSKAFSKIFESLTQRLNYVFHVLANQFPSTKKVILHDFAFQFEEQKLEFNEILFHEGDSPDYVYIMKSGEIDYRKKLKILNEYHEKRLSMINSGDIFGQEDIFQVQRNYSVYSCVNNSIVYKIKKDVLLLFQFIQQIKQSVRTKSDYLNKKLQEMMGRNSNAEEGGMTYHEQGQIRSQKTLLRSTSSLNQGLMNNSEINNSSGPAKNNSQIRMSTQQNHNQSKSSLSSMHYVPNLNNNSSNYFFQTKNANLGESDCDLNLKSITSSSNLEAAQNPSLISKDSLAASNNKVMKGNKKGTLNAIQVTQTSRAQPESIYSRITRPDSGFKEEIEQMHKEKADQLTRFDNQENGQQNITEQSQKSHYVISKNTKGADFKLSRMSKEMFPVQQQSKSEQKIKKRQAESIERKIQNQAAQEEDANKIQENISPPIGTSSSLKKYKDSAKEFFERCDEPKFVDFFAQFQQFSQGIQEKQMYEKLNKKEVKEDPFSHINFNVVESQLTSQAPNNNPLIIRHVTSSSDMDEEIKSSTSSQLLNKGMSSTNKFQINRFLQKASNIKKAANKFTKVALKTRELQAQKPFYAINSYNSASIGSITSSECLQQTVPTESDDIGEYEQLFNYSPLKSTQSDKQQGPKRISFAQTPVQILKSNIASKYAKQQYDAKKNDPNVMFQLRDNQESVQVSNFIRSNPVALYNSVSPLSSMKLEIEKDKMKQLESSLSFNNVRSAKVLRLGPPTTANPNMPRQPYRK